MSESILSNNSPEAENKPQKWSVSRRLSVAFEQTIRADGLFLMFLLAMSLGLALLCTANWERAEWKATATMRVASPTRENGSSVAKTNLLVSNVINELKSPQMLESMSTTLGDAWNSEEGKRLSNQAVIALGESAALQWTSPDKQSALLALELISQQMKSTSKELAKELHQKELADWSHRIATVDARMAELNKTLQEFQKKKGVVDVKGDLAALKDSITSLEYQLRLDLQAEVVAKEQYKEVVRQLDEAKRVSAMAIERENEDKSQQGTEKDLAKQRQILREAIQAEKAQLEQKALLEGKVNEKKQLEALAAQGKASPEGVLRLDTEIQVLKAKIAGNQKIADMENQLMGLEQTISLNGARKGRQNATSPVITALLDKKMDSELKLLKLAQEKIYLQQEIDAAKSKRDAIQSAEGEDAQYRQEKDRLVKEKETLEAKRQEAEWSGSERTFQVEWVQTPTIADQPVSTNRYQLFSAAFLSSSLLGFLGTFFWELGRSSSASEKRNLVWRRPGQTE